MSPDGTMVYVAMQGVDNARATVAYNAFTGDEIWSNVRPDLQGDDLQGIVKHQLELVKVECEGISN